MRQPSSALLQVAYVVTDIEAAVRTWTQTMGVGPFFIFENFALIEPKYRGQPCPTPNITIAASHSGGVGIELICPNDETPSVYREFLDAGRVGVHHIATMPSDYEAAITDFEARGHAVAFEGGLEVGARVAYMDTVAAIGHFTEFFEDTPGMRELLALTEDAAADWDGADPIRHL